MNCPNCTKEINSALNFCPFCGGKINAASTVESNPQFNNENADFTSPGTLRNDASSQNDYQVQSNYYDKIFYKFDENGGHYSFSWNWWAFFFGLLWYISKGLWVKAILILITAIIVNPIVGTLLCIYTGAFGNYDYYLKKVKNTQLW